MRGPIRLHGCEADVDVMVEAKAKERALLRYRQAALEAAGAVAPPPGRPRGALAGIPSGGKGGALLGGGVDRGEREGEGTAAGGAAAAVASGGGRRVRTRAQTAQRAKPAAAAASDDNDTSSNENDSSSDDASSDE